MAKRQLRTCTVCAKEEETFSKAKACAACTLAAKKTSSHQNEHQHLIKLGYQVIGEPTLTTHGHRRYKLIAPCCGSAFTPTYGNILKQLASHGKPPCQTCGGKARMSKAMSAYIDKYGAEYDTEQFEEYRLKVRRLTDRTYECWKHLINPMDYPRGHGAGKWHLDHKVPVIWCFKNGIAPEVAAGAQNLQMLTSEENLQKSGKLLSDEKAAALLRESQSSSQLFAAIGDEARSTIDFVADTANVFTTEKITVREAEFINSPTAVIARCNYHLGKIVDRVGARKLTIREVSPVEAKAFLETWHVQGPAPALTAVGLYNGSVLQSIMTFAKPRYKQAIADHELVRFCSRGDVVVQGAASKLFRWFLKNRDAQKIVSYSLNRWGGGDLYKCLGFVQVSSSLSPRYLWRKDGKIRSWRASVLMARRLEVPHSSGKIEDTLKIHDPGSTTWLFAKTPI